VFYYSLYIKFIFNINKLYIFIILHQEDEMQFLLSSYKFKNYDDVKNFDCILIDSS